MRRQPSNHSNTRFSHSSAYCTAPARPKYNGSVERGNRTFREEFYACRDLIADSIGAMRFELRKAVDKCNTFRPHHVLKGKTPMEYLRITQAEAA
nr:transposase [Octadecabacter arcticus]